MMVAMTGYGRTEDREAAHAAGFDVHMVKPADLEELRRVLAHDPTHFQKLICRRRRQRRARLVPDAASSICSSGWSRRKKK